MLDALAPFGEYGQVVLAREYEVAGVVEEVEKAGLRALHEPIDLLGGLDAGAHVVVVGEGHALFLRALAQAIEARREPFPLLVGEGRLGLEDREVLALDRVALLGGADDAGAHRVEEVAMLDELLLDLLVGLGREEGGEPRVADGEAAQPPGPC